MGVRTALTRLAARNAHVLVVEVPGSWRIRAEVERAALERGWSLATSPGDADVLAICGELSTSVGDAVEEIWQQLPGPRVRIELHHVDEASSRLEQARHQLLDTAHHKRDAHDRPVLSERLNESGSDMDMGGDEDMDMDMDGDMDMDMEMAPSGIALAEGSGDRDGLEMDVLHVRLGVSLPYWPAGLVLRCTLQGDVIVDAVPEAIAVQSEADDDDRAARHVDNLVSMLSLAGWGGAATEARAVRDGLLGHRMEDAARRLASLQDRVKRSRMLRWSLRNLLVLSAEDLQRLDMPSGLGGDTYDRLCAMIDRAVQLLDGDGDSAPWAPSTELVAQLVTGLDVATARLVVASLDIHTLTSGATSEESHAQ